MYSTSMRQDKPSLTIRLKINTLQKNTAYDAVKFSAKKDKKRHRKSKIRKHRKHSLSTGSKSQSTQINNRKTVYWISERIEPTKFILRTVMTN